jgi:hemerythrin superfamily protein
MDALQMLEQDHRKVKILFREAKDANDPRKRKEVFDKIDTELEIHTHIEETVFYPAIEKRDEFKEIVAEALEEHREAKTLLDELEDLEAEDDEFELKLEELIEAVEHHVEEEEGEMFPKIREVFDRTQLEQLGQELESAKGGGHRQAV